MLRQKKRIDDEWKSNELNASMSDNEHHRSLRVDEDIPAYFGEQNLYAAYVYDTVKMIDTVVKRFLNDRETKRHFRDFGREYMRSNASDDVHSLNRFKRKITNHFYDKSPEIIKNKMFNSVSSGNEKQCFKIDENGDREMDFEILSFGTSSRQLRFNFFLLENVTS